MRAELAPQIEALLEKQRDFEQYSDGSWAGGYFTEAGAVKDQRWLSTSLLASFKPYYGFLTSGVVDLTTPYVPGRDEGRISELRAVEQRGGDVEARIQASADLVELESLRERWERSKRYERHALEKKPELLYRLRRDSVFRHVQQSRLDMDEYVEQFVVTQGEALAKELEKHGLLSPRTVFPPRIRGEPSGDPKRVYSIDSFKDALKERLKADYERSRDLTAEHLRIDKERAARTAANVIQAKTAFQNEMMGMAVGALADDEEHARFLTALRAAAIRRAAPVVNATFHVVSVNPRDFRDRARGRPLEGFEAFDVHVTADVTADETIYHGPYTVKAAFLKASNVDDPGNATGGLPLSDEARKAIGALAAQHREEIAKRRGMIGIATVVAAGMADLSGAPEAAVSHLPGRTWRGLRGEVVIGQQVAFIPITPLEVRADPIRVVVMDQGGRLMTGKEGLVSIAGKAAKPTETEYWGAHRFTSFGESAEIAAVHVLADGKALEARKNLAIDDLENWLEPQAPPPIVLQLPLFLPGSFTLVGKVVAGAAGRTRAPDRCRITSAALGIDQEVLLPPAADGSFRLAVDAIVPSGGAIRLEVTAASGAVRHTGRAERPVPARPGDVDFGTITLAADTDALVVVPGWDREHPPTLAQYKALLSPLDLHAAPVIGSAAPRQGFDHRVSGTEPSAGSSVARGTTVAVELFGRFAPVAPDDPGRAPDPPDPPRPAAPRRPYYAVFAVTMPELLPAARARMPKQGDQEPKEAYQARKNEFISRLADSEFRLKDLPETESALAIHVSHAALEKYPPAFFRAGERYACRLGAGGKNQEGRAFRIQGAVLLTFRRFFDRLEDVTAAYPSIKKQKEMQAVAFTTADGLAEVRQEAQQAVSTWGPITAGWTDQDRRDAIELIKLIMQMFDCFVATAVYGDPEAPEVRTLRTFRDEVLLRSDAGRRFAAIYYRSGPRWARIAGRHPALARGARAALSAGAWMLDRVDLADPRLRRATEWASRLGVALLDGSAPADGDDWNAIATDLAERWILEGGSP